MIPDFESMSCKNCCYSSLVRDGHGLVTGFECAKGVLRVITWDIGSVMHCGHWSEVDDDE